MLSWLPHCKSRGNDWDLNVKVNLVEEKYEDYEVLEHSVLFSNEDDEIKKDSGIELDPSELARLENAVAAAKSNLDRAESNEKTARTALDSAQASYDSAKREYDAAMDRYEAAERTVGDKQNKFDALVDSLDLASLTVLRDALKLLAGDVDHLHDEIEEDDKEHSLATVRSVEDVIGDALKRLDGKMVDEIADRHLDHV